MNKKSIFNVQSFALSALCMAMVGCGGDSSVNNLDDIPVSNIDGVITISGSNTVGSTLTANVTDANGTPDDIAFVWSVDGSVVADASTSEYTVAEADVEGTITVTASYVDGDNFSESVNASIEIPYVNTPASFDGAAISVASDASVAQTGTITVTDPDAAEEEAIEALTDVNTMYGTFSIDAAGAWSYTLDTANADVAALTADSDPLVDTVEITSADGTTQDVEITISAGVVTGPTTTQVAKITDDGDDTGELRYSLDAALTGKVTVSINKDDNAIGIKNGEEAAKDAYITLYNSTGSTSSGRAIADLRIQADKFALRDQDDIDVANPFTPGEWHDIEITWEAADADTPPMVTVTIDGVLVTEQPFSSPANAIGGVTNVAFRFSDNDSIVANAAYHVDNVKIYSDVAGTALVFEDDFESYAVDLPLGPDQGYASNTAYAVVAVIDAPAGSSDGEPGDTTGPGNTGNKMAKITDDGDDTGELRYSIDAALEGKVTASINKDDNAIGIKNGESAAKDAYITLYNSTGSTSSGRAIADLRIQADKFALRDQDGIDVANTYTPGSWHDIEISWTAADANTPPMVTVIIDGVAVTEQAFSSPANAIGGVTNVAFRFSDNDSTVADAAYHVDDVKIYSDAAGTTLLFEDDFESYATDTPLGPDQGYASNSAYVVVAVED